MKTFFGVWALLPVKLTNLELLGLQKHSGITKSRKYIILQRDSG